jgi:lipopolysaccharide export system permease protein
MLFDTSVRRELARTFGATMVVIVTIVMTMFLVRMLGQAARGQVAPQDVMLLMGYVALSELPTVLALSLFAAVVVTIGRMYRDSEMAIWFAAGIGLSRFVRPVLRTAWPVLVVIALLVVFARPWSQRASADLREQFEQRSDLSRVAPGVFQSSRDGSRVFFIESHSERDADARNVFVLNSRGDRESVTTAQSGRLESDGERRYLVLDHGQQNDTRLDSGVMTMASFERYRMLVSERAVQRAQERPPREQWTHELLRDPQPRQQGELAWRLGLLFGAGNLLLLAVGLSASDPRRPGNWNLVFALLGFVVYYNLISLMQAWVAGGRVGLGVAVFALHGTVFALALALIWWRENAAVATLRLWRRGI